MSDKTLDLTLELAPRARFDVVDLRRISPPNTRRSPAIPAVCTGRLTRPPAFSIRSLAARLSAQHIPTYVEAFRTLFPEGAGYEHDRLERRDDLDAEQRAVEPRNADSHLAFIASGLRTCVTHPNRAGEPVFFVDLDGVNDGRPRRRLTRLIGFRQERLVGRDAHRGAGVGAPDRLDQPEGSAPRRLRRSSPTS